MKSQIDLMSRLIFCACLERTSLAALASNRFAYHVQCKEEFLPCDLETALIIEPGINIFKLGKCSNFRVLYLVVSTDFP